MYCFNSNMCGCLDIPVAVKITAHSDSYNDTCPYQQLSIRREKLQINKNISFINEDNVDNITLCFKDLIFICELKEDADRLMTGQMIRYIDD